MGPATDKQLCLAFRGFLKDSLASMNTYPDGRVGWPRTISHKPVSLFHHGKLMRIVFFSVMMHCRSYEKSK